MMSTDVVEYPSTMNKRRRGPDEFGGYADDNGHSSMDVETNGSKKVKIEDAPPSRVLHIRNVPNDATESDICLLGVPFGPMVNLVLSKKVNQALLEIESIETAEEMVKYYSSHPPNMYGRTVIVQYSKHQHLETKQGNQSVDSALQAANQMVTNNANSEPQTVLRVMVENLYQHVINYLVLYKIFTRFGRLLRIICFTRNGQFQALLEMENSTAANAARLHLNGQNIYTGCCTLRIDFSKIQHIEVRTESEKSRDFERYPLTDAEKMALNAPPMSSHNNHSQQMNQMPGNFGMSQNSQNQQLPMLAHLSNLAGSSGGMGMSMKGPGLGSNNLMSMQMQMPQMRNQMQGGSNVLLVSNLDEERATPDGLFTLFGVYGDVIRVKIMFNKKDTALIQFVDTNQAHNAVENLQGVRLWEKNLKLVFSRHNQVQMPREGSDQGFTKDYTNNPLHRFKKPNSKNFMNIFPPSQVLHLSNLPSTITEDEIKDLFEEHGYNVVNFKFMQKEKKMALIQLESIDLAILALIELHNWPLSDTAHLRVSFSKATF